MNEYIYHNGSANTFIQFERGQNGAGKDNINIEAGGVNMLYIVESSGGAQANKVTINNGPADVDFQVKGANATCLSENLFRTDAANDRVGIGTQTPAVTLHVQGDTCVTGNIIGTLSTAAQTNITSLGTLTALTDR